MRIQEEVIFRNGILEEFVVGYMGTTTDPTGLHRSSYDARDINQLSSNRRTSKDEEIIFGRMFSAKVFAIDPSDVARSVTIPQRQKQSVITLYPTFATASHT